MFKKYAVLARLLEDFGDSMADPMDADLSTDPMLDVGLPDESVDVDLPNITLSEVDKATMCLLVANEQSLAKAKELIDRTSNAREAIKKLIQNQLVISGVAGYELTDTGTQFLEQLGLLSDGALTPVSKRLALAVFY